MKDLDPYLSPLASIQSAMFYLFLFDKNIQNIKFLRELKT